jgi:hypothetical protein
MILYRTALGVLAEDKGRYYAVPAEWDTVFARADPAADRQSGGLGCGRDLLAQPHRAYV